MPSIALAAVRVRGCGESGQGFRNNTVAWDKTISGNQPVKPPEQNPARGLGWPGSRMAPAARREPVYFSPPHPSPAAHNGVYGSGGEAPPDCYPQREEKQATLNHALGWAVTEPVTNPMINGQR